MKLLVIEGWLILLFVDLILRLCSFKGLYRVLHQQGAVRNKCGFSPDALSHAMNRACAFYFRRVSPLERSAAAALLLRRHGWHGELILGLQIFPADSYAWVEVEGKIVNDQPNLLENYQVLDRC